MTWCADCGHGQSEHVMNVKTLALPCTRIQNGLQCKCDNFVAERGVKHDASKLAWDLLPESLEDVVAVLTFGAAKYKPENWRHVDDARRRYVAAAFRHLWEIARGRNLDAETGMPHAAHLACCALFLGFLTRPAGLAKPSELVAEAVRALNARRSAGGT